MPIISQNQVVTNPPESLHRSILSTINENKNFTGQAMIGSGKGFFLQVLSDYRGNYPRMVANFAAVKQEYNRKCAEQLQYGIQNIESVIDCVMNPQNPIPKLPSHMERRLIKRLNQLYQQTPTIDWANRQWGQIRVLLEDDPNLNAPNSAPSWFQRWKNELRHPQHPNGPKKFATNLILLSYKTSVQICQPS